MAGRGSCRAWLHVRGSAEPRPADCQAILPLPLAVRKVMCKSEFTLTLSVAGHRELDRAPVSTTARVSSAAARKFAAMDPSELMRLAIEKCRQGIAAGQSPFGCAIARDGKLLSCSHNTVVLTTDITAHAEVNAIREACRAVGDIFLDGAIVATTCEPCPMCMAALHWARVDTVYYGATIADADDGRLQRAAAAGRRAAAARRQQAEAGAAACCRKNASNCLPSGRRIRTRKCIREMTNARMTNGE